MRELSDYLGIVRRRWAVLLAGLVLGLALAAFQAQSMPKTYTATSTVYVSMATGTSVADSYQGGLAAQQRVRSYLELVGSDFVLDRVIGQLGLGFSRADLRGKVSADSPPATSLLRITVTDTQPERARLLADEVVSQFRALVDDLETTERTAAPAARVAVVDRAERPTEPSGPARSKLLVAGGLAGLLLGGGLALLLDRFDRRVRTVADLTPLGQRLLGTVALGETSERDDLRAVRSLLPEDAKTVLCTGLGAHSEPALAVGLAGALAATGSRVLLIDADTTRTGASALLPASEIDRSASNGTPQPQPALATVGADDEMLVNASQTTTVLDLRAVQSAPPSAAMEKTQAAWHTGGLAALLRGDGSMDDAVTRWPGGGFTVLPLGAADGQTSDLLASGRFDAVLRAARDRYDHVVVDTAGPAATTDALAVAAKCAGTVGVVVLRKGRTDRAEAALTALAGAGATLTGIVAVEVSRGWWRRRGGKRMPAVPESGRER
ncbi:Wzz/FepE/Etk N-terminal domain-containing protein [Nocardia sp. R7R-8]|uniref:Wzz/FepE/Etk N-terminal domain-containing protein n=1 Tax=Nocardia sp. R7R-8 TaxID=3459304 RepID=UPI00403DDC82